MEELNKQINDDIGSSKAPMIMGNLLYAGSKVKSLRRAFKRGRLTEFGLLVSKRPFNNRANTSKRKGVHSRTGNEQKKIRL